MYRMVVPVLTVVGSKRLPLWVCEAMPLGGSWLAGRRPSEASGQTEEVPFGWLRAFIVAEARGAACGDLFRPAAQRSKSFRARATFPKGQCHQLKGNTCRRPQKASPRRGSCLRSRLKRCPRYTSFVYSDRRSYPGGDTSSDPPQAAAHLPLKGKAFGDENPRAEARGRVGHSAGLNCLGFIVGISPQHSCGAW